MQKFLGILALFAGCANAATPRISDPVACTEGEVYIGGYPTELSFKWKKPASFPNPSEIMVLQRAWELDCPNFSAKSDGQQVVFKSKTGKPQDALFPLKTGWEFYLNGYYKYPALKLDWVSLDLTLKWDGNDKIMVSGDVPTDVIAGYRLADGVLQPLAFEGKIQTTELPTDKKLDLFLKLKYPIIPPSWTYVGYDPAQMTLVLRRVQAFPEK